MTRKAKTPGQRAQEALDVEERRVTKLTKQRDRLRTELDAVSAERDRAVVRRDYLKQNPDLILGVPDRDAPARRNRTTPAASTGVNA